MQARLHRAGRHSLAAPRPLAVRSRLPGHRKGADQWRGGGRYPYTAAHSDCSKYETEARKSHGRRSGNTKSFRGPRREHQTDNDDEHGVEASETTGAGHTDCYMTSPL